VIGDLVGVVGVFGLLVGSAVLFVYSLYRLARACW